MDEFGRPLYGDVFGTGLNKEPEAHKLEVAKIRESGHWGEMLQEEESSEEEEEEEEDDDVSGDETVDDTESIADQSGASSVVSGMETPESLDLRKARPGASTPGDTSLDSQEPKALYQVLEQKQNSALGGLMVRALMYWVLGADVGWCWQGSTHKYAVPSMDKGTGAQLVQKQSAEGVEVTGY